MPGTHADPDAARGTHAATLLGRTLDDLGVEYLFGMDAPAALHAVLGDGRITPITARDERSAAFMADGYAKVRGTPGVLGVGGVGATNAIQGIIESWLSSTPVVALVEEGSGATRHKHDLQDIDRTPLFASITKWVGQIEHPGRVADLTVHGFKVATGGRPGPVYLGYPWDVLSADAGPGSTPRPGPSTYPAHRSAPDPSDVERAASMLAAARRPVIVAGGGVHIAGATAELDGLARLLGAAVATTPAGKGAFDELDPRSLGVVGSYAGGTGGRGRAANETVRRADLVVLVGTSTGSGATANWTVPDPGQTIVHLDVDPVEIGRNYPASIGVVADARLGLIAIAAALGSQGASRESWIDARAATEPEGDPIERDGAVDPRSLYDELQRTMDDETVVVADAGYCAAWALDRLLFREPGRRFLAPGAYGTLGYGLPAAMGAKLAAPTARVVCLTGDGGLGFSLAELETAARCGIAVTVIVLNNAALAWSAHYDRHFYGYDGATRLGDVDHAAVARALGCDGIRVTTASGFAGALAEATASSRTTVIDVLTDPEARPPVDMFD